jgi:L-aspartate oxidase
MKTQKVHHVDYAVVGCGIAGLRGAIELSDAGSILVLAKSGLTDSATEWAQGGIAAALSDEDEVSLHEQDTLLAGDGLCRPEAVKVLVEEGPRYIQELIEWGTQFDHAGTKLAFTREAAHSRSRILHAHGDSTGREIGRALLARAQSCPALQIIPFAFTTELLLEKQCVTGLRYLNEASGEIAEVHASAVLLATGGLGQVYSQTTNPMVATGDGMAIAYEAGAVLSDLEFVQFHPTALAIKGAPRFLLSEALRGEGGVLRNIDLERFMRRYHEAQELAPRDVVARAIVSEMHRTSSEHVYLDMTKKTEEFLKKRFPRIFETCLQYGLDISADLAPVRPAAHYAMGGVKTDLWGRTSLPCLYAAGETAASGVHGANRLASNSLLEGLVFGARAGAAMKKDCPVKKSGTAARHAEKHTKNPVRPPAKSGKEGSHAGNSAAASATTGCLPTFQQIRELMWKHVGILRNGKELAHTVEQLRSLSPPLTEHPSRASSELRNLWTLAQLIARSALAREESRGSHYRSEFPYRNDEDFLKHSAVAKEKDVSFDA